MVVTISSFVNHAFEVRWNLESVVSEFLSALEVSKRLTQRQLE